MTRGPYDIPDGPPAGWPDHQHTLWRYPEEDGLDEYFTEHYDERGLLVPRRGRALSSMGIGWASAATVGQGASRPSSPSAGCPLPDPVSDVSEPGGSRAGLV